MIRQALLLFVLCLAASSAWAQVATGTYPYGTFDNRGLDSINVGSLNIHLAIPLLNKPGRGLPFYYNLNYDSSVWTPTTVSGTQTWTPATNWGWRGDTEIATGYISYKTLVVNSPHAVSPDGTEISPSCITTSYSNFQYHDGFGVSHAFGLTTSYVGGSNCGSSTPSGSQVAPDGSGYTLNVTNYTTATLVNSQGKTIVPPNTIAGSGNAVDSNGNQINANGSGGFTDTLGKSVLTIAGGAPNNKTFSYTDASGNSQSVTMAYKPYPVQTAFKCSGISDYSATSVSLVDSISFPDGSSYHFAYESTPGVSGAVTGRLASVTEPAGGVISYTYTGSNSGVVCSDGSAAGLTRSIASTGSSAASTYTYARTVNAAAKTSHTDVADGMSVSNHSSYDFVLASPTVANSLTSTYYETNRAMYNGATNTPSILTRQTCYNASGTSCTTTAITLPIAQIDTYETLNGTQTHGATAYYNTYGLQTEQDTYDYAAGARGGLLRKELWTYPTSGIVNLLSSDTVRDGSGNQIGLTTYAYDETSGAGHAGLVTTSGLPQHGGAIGSQRGNLTTMTQWANVGSSITTASSYEDTGNPVITTTPNGKSSFVYDSATHAFLITSTPPTPSSGVSLAVEATSDANSGLALTAVDPNNQTTTYKSYNALLQPTEIDFPDGGKTTYSWSPNQQGVQQYLTASTHGDVETHLDGYERADQVAVLNGQNGNSWYQQDACFDANGRLQYQSYAYQGSGVGGGKNCTSSVADVYAYDALGRVLSIAHADGTKISYTYTGRATQVTDENGVTRISQVDGLGRITSICEASSKTLQVGSTTDKTPGACSQDIAANGFLTTYSYTTDSSKDQVTAITQSPEQTRTTVTDSLGRTISVTEPERGTTTYSYAYSTTAGLGLTVARKRLQANQTTNTAFTTTTTQYDAVGRVVSVSYNDNLTPTKQYLYDSSNWAEASSQHYLKGRLSLAETSNTGTLYSYDALGRTTSTWQCTPSGCGNSAYDKHMAFTYDWAGNLTSQVDPDAGNITYGRSPAGELTSVTNQTYTLSGSSGSSILLSNAVNGPNGAATYNYGNGLSQATSYDSLGRINGGWLCIGAPSIACQNQHDGFALNWSGARISGFTEDFLGRTTGDLGQFTPQYDDFNRLSGLTQNTTGQYASSWSRTFSYVYDRYGNRWQQNAPQGGPTFSQAYNAANNQLSTGGYAYDAAGNMTYDTFHHYTYDAEGNIVQADSGSTGTYVYDALNHRVQGMTSGNKAIEFIFDLSGRISSYWLPAATTAVQGNIYADGHQLAYRAGDGNTYFNHTDWLGTDRVHADLNGAVAAVYTSLPWGDGSTDTVYESDGGWDFNRFGDIDDDQESNTYHAPFRQYSQAQGRWLSPDPYDGSYDPTNPQSFNRYAYVLNNPLSLVDPSGLDGDCDDGACPGSWACQTYGFCGPDPIGCQPGDDACVTGNPPPNPNPCDALDCSGGSGGSGSGGGGSGGKSGGTSTGAAPNKGPTPTPQPCLAQRVGNALPGAQFTGVGNAVGGHQQFNFAVNTADLAADGFTPFKVLGLFSNGYRNGSFYLQVHVNGQNGAQLGDSSGIINVQGHIDVFNPAAGYGAGLILHGIWDLGVGSLFFHHRASLDPGCHS